jgi:GNAT superfamily N-acetyltransferase
MHSNQVIISPLLKPHHKNKFCCGEDSLDGYIKQQANQDIKRNISRVFIASTQNQPEQILGFYSLSSLSINCSSLPSETAKKLPRHAIPCALIGRLAVDKKAQGTGLGKLLLIDAFKRTRDVSQSIAIYALIVDCLNDKAKVFYKKFGFTELSTDNNRLFLQLKKLS